MALADDLLVILVIGVAGSRHTFAEPACPYKTPPEISLFNGFTVVLTALKNGLNLACSWSPACYCFSHSMVCNDLQKLPPMEIGSNILNVTDLTFEDGNISTISGNNSLPPDLVTVSFTSHPLTNISVDAFQGSSETLKHLTISRAKFTSLPAAFVKLHDLNHFNMDHTYIQDWDNATFENSTATLTNLALVSVGLTEWPTWLSLFRSLQVVDFSNNSLKSIPDNAFSFLTNTLLYLSLTDCNLTQLPRALSQLNNLTSLDLSGNILTSINGRPAIEQIGMFPLAKTLVKLWLQNSGLKVIPNFANLTKLTRINLDYNQISNSTSGSFSKSVTLLDLGENNLPSVPTVVAGMNNLTFLDLSYNNISSVNFDTLPLTLDMVDFSGNNIIQINDTTTKELAELTYLYMYKTLITSIPNTVFERLAALRTLDLESTNLTAIPMGFTMLKDLNTLSLRHIYSLSCPCPAPQELVTWFTSLKTNVTNIGVCTSGLQVEEYLQGTCTSGGAFFSFSVYCSCLMFLLLAYFSCL